MVTLDGPSSALIIAKSFDLTQRGIYPNAKLTARIEDSGYGVPLEVQIDFVVNIYPCPINDFRSNPTTMGTQTYEIGKEGITFGYTGFVQNLACGYVVEEQLTGNIPDVALLEYKKELKQFEVLQTEDLSFAATYSMQVVGKIKVPTDLAKPPMINEMQYNLDLTLVVENPCLSSTLDVFTVNNMAITVLGLAELQDLTSKKPKDSVSRLYGTKDGLSYCGERKFRIISSGHSQFLSYSDPLTTLTLLSTKDSDIGTDQPVELEAYLADYPTVTKSLTFLVTIEGCIVTSLTAAVTPD